MFVLTPAERRAAVLLVLLLALGAAADLLGVRGPEHPAGSPAADGAALTIGDSAERPPGPSASPPPSAGTLDLNRATARQLDDLPGVGPVLAARILEHRRRFGSFRTIEDLRAVRGIGPRLFERLRPRVRVGMPLQVAADTAIVDPHPSKGRPPRGVRTAPSRSADDALFPEAPRGHRR